MQTQNGALFTVEECLIMFLQAGMAHVSGPQMSAAVKKKPMIGDWDSPYGSAICCRFVLRRRVPATMKRTAYTLTMEFPYSSTTGNVWPWRRGVSREVLLAALKSRAINTQRSIRRCISCLFLISTGGRRHYCR